MTPSAREYVADQAATPGDIAFPAYLRPQPEHPDWRQWQALAYAPMDGTDVLLLVHHNNRRFAAPADQPQWEHAVRARWLGVGCWAWVDASHGQPVAGAIVGWRHWGSRSNNASVQPPAAPRPDSQEQP